MLHDCLCPIPVLNRATEEHSPGAQTCALAVVGSLQHLSLCSHFKTPLRKLFPASYENHLGVYHL